MAKMSIERALELARSHLDAGRVEEVEGICRAVLAASADEPEALRLLALAAYHAGNLAAAESMLCQAVAIEPRQWQLHSDLSAVLWRQRRFQEAEAEARQAVALAPHSARAANNLGNALQGQKRFEAAAEAYRAALAADPEMAEVYNNLAAVLQTLEGPREAIEAYRKAIALRPGFLDAMLNLGAACKTLGRWTEALDVYSQAISLTPQSAVAHQYLSSVWLELGRWQEAEAACRQAIALRPGYPKALLNLATALKGLHRYADAEAAARQAVAADPALAAGHSMLGNLLMAQGRVEEAAECHGKAVAADPADPWSHQKALMCEHYRPGVTPAHLAQVHRAWFEQHAARWQATWLPSAVRPDPDRPLRLGLLSEDFGCHPVGYFLVGGLANLDRQECRVYCYNDRAAPGAMTARIQSHADVWRDVRGLSDDALVRLVRADEIDVLFDLGGHTSRRLMVFARKPAPLQVSWLGYVGTTGLPAMDYLVADPYQVLAGTERHYCEKILRLPDGYVCFDPPEEAPPLGPLPAGRNGHVTLACFNNLAKINCDVIALWAAILRRLPGARLMLKFGPLGDPIVRRRFTELFAAEHVEPQRLELSGHSTRAELLCHYNHVDIALDTFPYSGGLTTCEALWMGVPVITWPGQTFASRHSLSHLSNAGLTETIARDPEEYVELAVKLAGDLPRLAELRAGLRRRVAESPLCDGKRFAGNLMRLLRGVWRDSCCAGKSSAAPK